MQYTYLRTTKFFYDHKTRNQFLNRCAIQKNIYIWMTQQ